MMGVDLKKLLTLEEAAEENLMEPERLRELADAGYAPHYRIDGGPPMFHRVTLRQWVWDNAMQTIHGRSMTDNIVICRHESLPARKCPPELAMLDGLMLLHEPVLPPGVYFLVKGRRVVYVGQSIRVGARIYDHQLTKSFDSAYFLPVPEYDLAAVEARFICELQPKYNQRIPGRGDRKIDEEEADALPS